MAADADALYQLFKSTQENLPGDFDDDSDFDPDVSESATDSDSDPDSHWSAEVSLSDCSEVHSRTIEVYMMCVFTSCHRI
jgi:hypothetical protein